MANDSERWLVEQRAKILAMVQFTSRPDLQVSDFPEGGGIDLLARIISKGASHEKLFGVKIRGTKIVLADADRASRYLRTTNWYRKEMEGKFSQKYSFPVIVLLFSMENDKGYFAWTIEPLLTPAGEPKLRVNDTMTCGQFDRSSLSTIVDRVIAWHDSLATLLEAV